MFDKAETEVYYAAFNRGYQGSLSVYVDGSFDCDYAQTETSIPMGAGWAVVDKDENLIGYGIAGLTMPPTKSSEKFELNAMLTFLDAMQESFPENINREFPVRLICDNQILINHLNEGVESEEGSRICHKRYGDYYARLAYYMSVMDLSFQWIRGHTVSDFNRLADFQAHKAYKTVKDGHVFDNETRRQYSEYVTRLFLDDKFPFKQKEKGLTFRQLRKMVSTSGVKPLTEIPTLWVAMQKEEYKGRTFAGFSFADTELKKKGVKGGVFLSKPNDFVLSVRAINYALSNYSMPQKLSGPVVVRTDNAQAASLINTINSGNKWRALIAKDRGLANEVEKLKAFIKIQPVIALEVSDFAHTYKTHAGMMASKKHSDKAARSVVDMLVKVAD